MNASIAIQVLPMDVPQDQVVPVVDAVIAHLAASGIPYQVGPFETTLEGDYDEMMAVIKEVPRVAAKAGASSDMIYIKIHYFPENEGLTIDEKTSKFKH
ncbi:thiamine-binding protein [Lacticaseibacillus saniviri]|uniref:Thiamine-binding protein domain-containing protein n=1 Tax=Lacticaseibacillus saniviri JCM 17471 = DSM 24301 TaxID=1293598 RepID=A0A0R2MPL0_9LACO|nr:thiamine-binding protein [Lacticaseibacillus saniviri]KRO15573.1 hypothetical protein IV56_GL002342 [Lacticaseibacillus saniviri JCM 17471 = DSM 24301]MCG4280970.1 thiamine-binding protein [Lacticaseibacillus saniviri]